MVAARRRLADETQGATNASLTTRDLERVAALSEVASNMLAQAAQRLGLSARAYTKVLRVARTIADLAGAASIHAEHVAEAVSLRVLDRGTPPVRAVA